MAGADSGGLKRTLTGPLVVLATSNAPVPKIVRSVTSSLSSVVPKPPARLTPQSACNLCDKKADYWCVDCGQLTCPGCTARMHHPGTKTTKHSIEEVDWEGEAGAQVSGPLLGNIILIVAFVYFMQSALGQFNESYMATANICPVVKFASNWMASFDTKVFYYFKSDLASFCSMEDSFFRLFIDGWVRNVVTDTDDTVLVLITSWKAVVASLVVRFFMVPVVAVVYALSTKLAIILDPIINQSISKETIDWLEDLLGKWQPLSRVGPPLTKPRRRPDIDDLERLQYLWGRWTRDFKYAYQNAEGTLNYYLYTGVWYCVILRLFCIWSFDLTGFRIGSVVRAFLNPFVGGMLEQQRDWFGGSAKDTFSDESLLWALSHFIRGMISFEMKVVPDGVKFVVMKLGAFLLSLFILRRAVVYYIWDVYLKRQQTEFDEKWQEREKGLYNGYNGLSKSK